MNPTDAGLLFGLGILLAVIVALLWVLLTTRKPRR